MKEIELANLTPPIFQAPSQCGLTTIEHVRDILQTSCAHQWICVKAGQPERMLSCRSSARTCPPEGQSVS